MESARVQAPLRVKNTFIDLPLESDFFGAIPVLRGGSLPASSYVYILKEHEERVGTSSASEDDRQEKTHEKPIHMMDRIEGMPATKFDKWVTESRFKSSSAFGHEQLAVEAVDSQLLRDDAFCGSAHSLAHKNPSDPTRVDLNSHKSFSMLGDGFLQTSALGTCNHAQPSSGTSSGQVTTLMLCNLPCKLTQEDLAQAVDQLGFTGAYDLVYVPRGSNKQVGYGFINFTSAEAGARFSELITSFTFSTAKTNRPVRVMAAKVQGFEETLASIRKGGNFRKRSHAPLTFCPHDRAR